MKRTFIMVLDSFGIGASETPNVLRPGFRHPGPHRREFARAVR